MNYVLKKVFMYLICSFCVVFLSFVHIFILIGSSLKKVLCLLVNCFEHFLIKKHFSKWHFSTTTYPHNIQFCIHLHYIHSVSSVKDHSCNTHNQKVTLVWKCHLCGFRTKCPARAYIMPVIYFLIIKKCYLKQISARR